MPDVDIAVNIGGNMASGLKNIQEATRKYKSDVDGLQRKLDEFNRMQAKVKTELDKAKKEVKSASKDYEQFGDEISKAKSEAANFKLQGIKDEMEAVSKAAKQTKKDMEALAATERKNNNRGGIKAEGVKAALAKQAVDELAQVTTEAINYGVTSVFGQEAGNVVGGALSSALSMGAAGAAIGGPVGAAIGAGIGLVTGAVSGSIQNEQNKDDFYKGIVQERYSQSQQNRAQLLEAGSATAAGRELDAIAFKKLIGENSEEYLEWVKKTGAETPFEYSDLTSLSKTMATYGYTSDEMKDLLIKIGDTGANLGLDASGMSMLATGLGRMKSSNKTTLEYLNLLLERGVPVIDYLSEGLGKSKGEIYDMVSKGLIPGSEAASIIAEKMGADNFGAMDEMSRTFSGLMSNMEDFWTNMDAAQGEGFNSTRVSFLERQTKWAEDVSKEMELAKSIVGELQADEQNEREQALRDAYNKIFQSAEFKELKDLLSKQDAGVQLTPEEEQKLINHKREIAEKMATVEAEAEAEYMKSEGAQIRQKSELDIIAKIQEATADAWYNYGYDAQIQMNKGRAAAGTKTGADNPNEPGTAQGALVNFTSWLFHGGELPGGAFGFTNIPYDNFPAMLHQGEAVLTASQARQWREGKSGSGGIVISGNQFTIREDADVVKVAEELLRQIVNAKEGYVGA